MVSLSWLLSLFLITLSKLAAALQCDKDGLAEFRFHDYFKGITTKSFIKDTPPSQTNYTWYFNLCGQEEMTIADCPKDSQLCGIQTVTLPGEAPIKTQIISFKKDITYTIKEKEKTHLSIALDKMSWGSSEISPMFHFDCLKDDVDDNVTVEWENSSFTLNWKTPAACLKTEKGVPPPKKDDGKKGNSEKDIDNSWGWFTWLFIVFVLLFGGYIIIGAWITASKSPADFQDALHDFTETLFNLARPLPGFISEIFGKVFGSSGSDRGGYSAV